MKYKPKVQHIVAQSRDLGHLGESSGGELGLRDAADEKCPPFLVLLAIRKF